MASKTESAQRPGARTDAPTKGVGAEGTAAWKATLQGDDWSRLIISALNTRYWRTCISIAAFQMGGKQKQRQQKHKTAEAQDRVRDLKVRRFTEVRANRENPGVHRTSGRAGPRGHPVRERWLSVWPANATQRVSRSRLRLGVRVRPLLCRAPKRQQKTEEEESELRSDWQAEARPTARTPKADAVSTLLQSRVR